MRRTRVLLLSAATAAVMSLALASGSVAAEAFEYYAKQYVAVEQSADLAADTVAHTDTAAVQTWRLPEAPGGVIAVGADSANHLATDQEEASLPGGAAGLASTGIRGPTHA